MTQRSGRAPDQQALLDEALRLHGLGLPITLNVPGAKAPLGVGWSKTSIGNKWQFKKWSVAEIKRAFRVRGALNVGLRWGPDSGMIDIEADNEQEERAFAALFEGCDKSVTPTFSSRRGKHRLFAWHPDLERIGKAEVKFDGIAIKIGANGKGSQSLLPPSIANGVIRWWLVSLDECDPPRLPDLVVQRILAANKIRKAGSRGFCERTETQQTQAMANMSAARAVSTVSRMDRNGRSESIRPNRIVCSAAVEKAIVATLPTGPGQRNGLLFEFVRHLKAIPELAAADILDLNPYVVEWHRQALPFIQTKGFSESWLDFRNAWKNAKYPAGEEPITMIFKEAIAAGLPPAANKYPEPELKQLVALCRQLQRFHRDKPFYLDCRTAGALIGVDHRMAWKWLNLLVLEEVLKLVKVGTRHKASEYRYLAAD